MGDLHSPVNIENTKPTPSAGQNSSETFYICFNFYNLFVWASKTRYTPGSDISEDVFAGQQREKL